MLSFWEHKFWFDTYDILIVGAGFTGLLTAINLKKINSNLKVAIIERAPIPSGASTKNAGFACFASLGEILDDLETVDQNTVLETIRMRWEGLKLLKENIPVMSMDFEKSGGIEVFDNKSSFDECASQLQNVNEIIEEATGIKDCISIQNQSGMNFYKYAFKNPFEGLLNPVRINKFLIEEAKHQGIKMHFGIEVESYEPNNDGLAVKMTNGLTIHAHNIALCTNAFAKKLLTDIDLTPYRNQVLVTSPIKTLDLIGGFHFDKGYTYFRNMPENRILIGGARNLDAQNERTDEFGENTHIIQHLKSFLNKYLPYPNIRIEYNWSGIIGVGTSKYPEIRRIDKGLYVGARLGGMGVAIASKVANDLADLIYRDSY